MKTIKLLAIYGILSTYSFGQKTDRKFHSDQINKSEKAEMNVLSKLQKNNYSKKNEGAVDTAGIEFTNEELVIYSYQNTIVFGTNPFADLSFAQVYPYFGSGIDVEQVLIKFGHMNSNMDPTRSVDVNLYETNTSNNPSTIKKSIELTMNHVDTTYLDPKKFTVIDLNNPVNFTKSFAVGINVERLYDDDGLSNFQWLGLASTKQDGVLRSNNARVYVQLSEGAPYTWETVETAWGSIGLSNINLILLPVVNETYATGIEESQFINDTKLSCFPNPSSDFLKIDYEIKEPSTVELQLIDLQGNIVLNNSYANMSAGKHQATIDITNIVPGQYFYSINASGKSLTKKLIIQ